MVLLIGAWTAWRAYCDYTAEYVVVPPSFLAPSVLHSKAPPAEVWQVKPLTQPRPFGFHLVSGLVRGGAAVVPRTKRAALARASRGGVAGELAIFVGPWSTAYR